jgi:hypothetical protein
VVAATTDALAPALLPMIEILGQLDEEELQNLSGTGVGDDLAEDVA